MGLRPLRLGLRPRGDVVTAYCIHARLSAICRECADPLDVSALAFMAATGQPPRGPAAVSGWMAAIPILAAVLILGIVIGRWTA